MVPNILLKSLLVPSARHSLYLWFSRISSLITMHGYSLAVLTTTAIVVASSPLTSRSSETHLIPSASTSVSWTPERRQLLGSGCTTTLMGDLRNPCVRSQEWTSTVTEYTAVDCHGCASVYVVKPKWHCPPVISTVAPQPANGPSTLTSTICLSTPVPAEPALQTQIPALAVQTDHPVPIPLPLNLWPRPDMREQKESWDYWRCREDE